MNNHDKLILKVFLNKNGKFNNRRTSKIINYSNIKKYLYNRYNDSDSLQETLMRIKLHIDVHPKCPICGNKVKFSNRYNNPFRTYCSIKCMKKSNIVKEKTKQTYFKKYGTKYYNNRIKSKNTCLNKYGVDNPSKVPEIKEKKIKTSFIHYGVDNPYKSNKIKEKIKQTCLEKYGVEYPTQNKEIYNKIKQTCLRKYGVEHVLQSNIFKEKFINTCLIKYGASNNLKLDKIKEKIKQTYLNKYGVKYPSQIPEVRLKLKTILSSKEVQDKINETKRKNNSFNISKPEEQLYKDIYKIYPSVKRQYNKDERYPFNCDFYIKELDMFIELQGSWTHGGHPFSNDSKEDQLILEKWKLKDTKYYDNAITTWTIRDVNKRKTAKKNNLNYVELFNKEDIQLFLTKLKEFKNNEKSK